MAHMARRLRPVAVAAGALAVVIFALAVQASGRGYLPIGDDAWAALSAESIARGHFPVLGPVSTATLENDFQARHLGPLYFYWLALPAALFGSSGLTLVLGQALLTVLGAVGAVLAAGRALGRAAGLATAGFVLLLIWALGPEIVYRTFNPYAALVVLPYLILATVALRRGDRRHLPWFVAAASLALQSHLSAAPLVAVLVVMALWPRGWSRWWAGLGQPFWWWRRRIRMWARRTLGRPTPERAALIVGALAWTPVVIGWFTYSPNNLSLLWDYLRQARGERVHWAQAAEFVTRMTVPFADGYQAQGEGFGAAWYAPPAGWALIATGALILFGPGLLALVARSPRAHALAETMSPALRVAAGVVAVLAFVCVVTLQGATPEQMITPWQYLVVWPVVHAAWTVWVALAARVLSRYLLRPKATHWLRRISYAGAVALLPLGLVLAGASPVQRDPHNDELVASVLPKLRAAVDARREITPGAQRDVSFIGSSLGGQFALSPALGWQFLVWGYPVHVPTLSRQPEDIEFRQYATEPTPCVVVFILDEQGLIDYTHEDGTTVATFTWNRDPHTVFVGDRSTFQLRKK